MGTTGSLDVGYIAQTSIVVATHAPTGNGSGAAGVKPFAGGQRAPFITSKFSSAILKPDLENIIINGVSIRSMHKIAQKSVKAP